MILPLLAALALAPAQTANCDEVRRVHGLAVAQGLDDTTLRTLEARTCNAPPSSSNAYASQACLDLEIMSTLGRTGGGAAGLEQVDVLKNVACSLGLSSDRVNWKNGTTARYANGSWSWPSGTTAKYANGSWNWPSGTTAKYVNGSWNWPSGTTARYENGRYNDPTGTSSSREQILVGACAKKPRRCQELSATEARDPDLGMARFLELALHP